MKVPKLSLPALRLKGLSLAPLRNSLSKGVVFFTSFPGADFVFLSLLLREIRPVVYGVLVARNYSCVSDVWFRLYDYLAIYLMVVGIAIYFIRRVRNGKKISS